MDLEGHQIRSMSIDGYRHKYKGFLKSSHPESQAIVNRGRTTRIRGPKRA